MIDYNKYIEKEGSFFSSINIVPFTDIILVLLIVFMIAAPGLAHFGIGIELPGAKTYDSNIPTHINIVLDKGGQFYLEGSPYSIANLERELRGLLEKRRNLAVIISADRQSAHGRVVEIMDMMRTIGIRKIYVGTSEE